MANALAFLADPAFYDEMANTAKGYGESIGNALSNADKTTYNALSNLSKYEPGYEYSSIIPARKNKLTRQVEFAAPTMIKDLATAITAPIRAYRGEFDANSPQGMMEAINLALNTMGGGMGASTATKTGGGKGELGMFAGVGAKTADLVKLNEAQRLAKAGVPDEEVWKATGWTSGFPDKKWRFEIPDNEAKLTQAYKDERRSGAGIDINKALEHKDLWNAYPEVGDYGANFSDATLQGGRFSPSHYGGYIEVGYGNPQPKSVTLHELTHAIQDEEGFARGGSPEEFTQAAKAEVTRDALSWKNELLKKRQAMPNADWTAVENAVVNDYQQLGAMDMLPSREARDLALQPYILHGEKNYPEDFSKAQELVNLYGLDTRTSPLKPYDIYQRLAGEAEARLTEARMKLTPAERLAQYPVSQFDVPVEQQIVRYGSSEANSVPDRNTIKLYRGMENPFDPAFDLTRTDAPSGYSTWTNNPELARQYAGSKGHVYEISLPKKLQGKEMLDPEGERVLFLNNQKPAGLNGITGDEYLIYNEHDLYSPNLIKKYEK